MVLWRWSLWTMKLAWGPVCCKSAWSPIICPVRAAYLSVQMPTQFSTMTGSSTALNISLRVQLSESGKQNLCFSCRFSSKQHLTNASSWAIRRHILIRRFEEQIFDCMLSEKWTFKSFIIFLTMRFLWLLETTMSLRYCWGFLFLVINFETLK